MSSEDRDARDVKRWIQSLGTQTDISALPDPDRLWMRAQIAARHAAAVRALRVSTLRQTLHVGILVAGLVWLFVESIAGEEDGVNALTRLIASISAEPVAGVAVSAVAALGIALFTGSLVLGRLPMARRLRYLGLL